MNYKIIIFKCGCKYIWLNGKGRPYKTCPEHKRPVGAYILWCQICGKRIKAVPQAGYRQKRCSDCKVIWERQEARKWAANHPGYWQGRDMNKYRKEKQVAVKTPETEKDEKKRQLTEWFEFMRAMFAPVWEGI